MRELKNTDEELKYSIARVNETEWAHALAGGLSVWGAEGSVGQRPNVPEAGAIDRLRNHNKREKIIYLDMKYLIVVAHPDDEVLGHLFTSGLITGTQLMFAS